MQEIELGGPGTGTDDGPEDRHREPENEAAEQDFDALLASLPEDGMQVQIMRYNRKGKREWVETWGADGFELADVRRAFGGGKFMLRLLDSGGRYMKGKTVQIAGPERDQDELELEDEEPRRRQESPAELAEVRSELARLAGRFERMYEDLRRPAPEHQQQNPADLFSSMLTAVQAATEPLRETIRTMQDRDRDDDRSATAALLQGVQLGQELARGAGGNGMDSVVERLGVPLLEYLQNSGRAPTSPALPNPPAAAAAPDMIETDKLPSDPAPRWPGFLGPYLPALMQMAERGLDPGLRAAVILDEIPGGYYATIGDELAREGFRDEFFKAVPTAAQHRPWLDEFFNAAISELTGGEGSADDE